jgi:hypothetical protein
MAPPRAISVQRVVHSTAARIFDVLADPARHASIDGSGHVDAPAASHARLALGSTFSMHMSIGLPYVTKNRVVEFEEGRRIAWHHFARFIWRYELEPRGDDTLVTETFDYSAPWGVLIVPTGWPQRNRTSMERTLATLDELLSDAPQEPQ